MALIPLSAKIAKARSLEQQGQLEAAARAYVEIGASGDAGRVLVALRRYDEAGEILLRGLGVSPSQVGQLPADKRKEALTAAICFARTGKNAMAVQLFVALGEHPRAIEVLERAGDHEGAKRVREHAMNPAVHGVGGGPAVSATGATSVRIQQARALEQSGKLKDALDVYVELKQYGHAARVAQQMGMQERAADLFIDAGMPFESALCYQQIGDTGRCLDTLTRIPRDDARYRSAAVLAVGLASQLGVIDFAFEQFLVLFLEQAPLDDREAEALYQLARLYEKHGHREHSMELLEKLEARRPGFRDVGKLLSIYQAERKANPRAFQRVLEEDMRFHQSGPRGALPDLPDLPDLPPVGTEPRRAQSRALPKGREAVATTSAKPEWQPPAAAQAPATIYTGAPQAFGPPPPYGSATHVDVAAATLHQPNASAEAQNAYARVSSLPTQHNAPGAAAPAPDADPKASLAAFEVGNTIAGRYRLERKIGRGGMAIVFKAHDTELEIDIALKVFQQPIEDDEQLLRRFKQELVLSRQLTHRNIIRLYDIGFHGAHRYITMELLSGSELKAQLGVPMEIRRGVDYLIQACEGLQFAHEAGIVHRDVKPQNFFVTQANVLKVMDFGIAKRQAAEGMTVTGMIAGTPNYMSPEQINAFSTVTASTDIYAIGCIAYEMFTGSVPFQHPELMPLLMMHLTKAPEAPKKRAPHLPDALEQIILKLLEKDPARRYPSCRALAQDLAAFRGGLG